MDILLSIKPRFVRCLREHRKFVELRKQFPTDRDIGTIFVYESSPVKRISGCIRPRIIRRLPVAELWERTRAISCVEERDFWTYYQGRETGVGIFFDEFVPMPLTPLALVGKRAPQNYAWLTPAESHVLKQILDPVAATLPAEEG